MPPNIFIHSSMKQGLTLSGSSKAAHAVEEAATRGSCQHPGSRSSALRYYASAAQDMHSRACDVCMPEAAGVRSLSGPRVSGCLPVPRANLCGVHRASCDD